jgi:uncharacterized membrane protein YvlD (DUF360 family)
MVTAIALWLAAELVSGVGLAESLDALDTIGTLLVVALLLVAADTLTARVRRVLVLRCDPLPFAVVAAVALHTALFWAVARVAELAGLGYTVTGLLPALLGSLVLLTVRLVHNGR